MITITEQCGAVWAAYFTNVPGPRAVWVQLMRGSSLARPSLIGFYAASMTAALDALSN